MTDTEQPRHLTAMDVTEAKREFSDVISGVAFGGKRILLKRHNKVVAAIVPATDLTDEERAA